MKGVMRWIGLIGILLFLFLISRIDRAALLGLYASLDWPYFILSLALMIPSVGLKAWKWMALLGDKEKIPFLRAVGAWVAGFGAGIVTPAKAGDFFRAGFLKAPAARSFMSVLVDRLIDVIALLALGGLSAVLIFSRSDPLFGLTYIFFVLLFLFFIAAAAAANKKFVCRFLGPFYDRLVPEKIKAKSGRNISAFYGSLGRVGKRRAAFNMLLTLLAWLIFFGQYWALSLALGLGLSYSEVFLAAPVLILVQLIPVSVLGIGTRDAASILLLSSFGVSAEQAIAFSLGILIEDLILGGVGLIILLRLGKLHENRFLRRK